MIQYQVQFLGKINNSVAETDEAWIVVSNHDSLKSAKNFAKVLIRKHGYDVIRICRSTNMKIYLELES